MWCFMEEEPQSSPTKIFLNGITNWQWKIKSGFKELEM